MTFYKQVKALFSCIMLASFYTLLIIYLDIDLDKKFCLYVLFPLVSISIIPVLIIHFNYYLAGRGTSYEINQKSIVVIGKNKKIAYQMDEITHIIFYMTVNKLLDSAIGNFVFRDYFYAEIIFSDHQKTIITCLHSDKIDEILTENFKGVKISKVKTFFPIIKDREFVGK